MKASAILMVFLMGCQQAGQEDIDKSVNHSILKFNTEEGVECIYYGSGTQAGISCNWDKYNKDQAK